MLKWCDRCCKEAERFFVPRRSDVLKATLPDMPFLAFCKEHDGIAGFYARPEGAWVETDRTVVLVMQVMES